MGRQLLLYYFGDLTMPQKCAIWHKLFSGLDQAFPINSIRICYQMYDNRAAYVQRAETVTSYGFRLY